MSEDEDAFHHSEPKHTRMRTHEENQTIRLDPESDEYAAFVAHATQDCYRLHKFPPIDQARQASSLILKRIKNINEDDPNDFLISSGLIDKYLEVISRSWLNSYEFPEEFIPRDVSLDDNLVLVNYMLENLRYAKKDFSETGIYLFSLAIIDYISKAMLNRRRGQKRLYPIRTIIPRTIITLITTMIKYRLVKQADKAGHVHPGGGTDFSNGSHWHHLYESLGINDRKPSRISWKYVERHVSASTFGSLKTQDNNEPSDVDFDEISVELLIYDTDSED